MNKRSKISQAIEESCIGLPMALLFTGAKYFIDKKFILSEAIFSVIFMIIFFFLKGYFFGATSEKMKRQMIEKKEEMFDKMKDLKCFKCLHPIDPDENKCPNCGWTWEI